jgi:site-specific recombinase XerD
VLEIVAERSPEELRPVLDAAPGALARTDRDHVLYSMALATGLREHELAGLDVSDVFEPDGKVKIAAVLGEQNARESSVPDTAAGDATSTLTGERRGAPRHWSSP